MSPLAAASMLSGLAAAVAIGRTPEQLIEQRLGVVRKDAWSGSRLLLFRDRCRSHGWDPRRVFWAVGALISSAMWIDVHLLVPAALAGVAVAGSLRIRSTMAARTKARRREARLVETCDQLAAELSSGQSPPRALQHAADLWPELTPVAAASRLGGDVPGAWRLVAELPGAGSLRALAAAWQVAERSGAGLTVVLERMSDALRAEDAVRREIEAALGPPRATARLLAALPAFGLLLGIGLGGDPVGFLLRTPLGAGCLTVGLAFAVTGVWWVDRLAVAAQR
ncbi:MAG: type II secretion system F family protein [Nocardioidaceae bacterium]